MYAENVIFCSFAPLVDVFLHGAQFCEGSLPSAHHLAQLRWIAKFPVSKENKWICVPVCVELSLACLQSLTNFFWYLKLSVKRSSTAERWSIAKIKVPQSWRVAQILFGPISNKSMLIAVFCLSSAATPPKHLQYSFTLRLGREAVFPAKLLC